MKGPWQYQVFGQTGNDECVQYEITPEGSTGWKDDEYLSMSGICSEDAVRKMAAAPDMFDALEAVLRVADRSTVEFDMARAALAKARGDE